MFIFKKKPKPFIGGALDNPQDPRDIIAGSFQKQKKKLPEKFITDISMIPVFDQLQNPSCVGQAIATVVAYHMVQEGGITAIPSARYLYGLAKRMDGIPLQGGTFPRIGGNIVRNLGCATESTVSNDNKLSHREYVSFEVTPQVTQDALPQKVQGYAFVNADINELKNAVINNGVVCVSLRLGNWNRQPVRPGTGGAHYVVVYGYDGDTFLFRNSWGERWGKNGNGTFRWRDHQNTIRDIMVITDVPKVVIEEKKEEWKQEVQDGKFTKVIDHIIKWEGGYVNHPQDPGGETKYGISKRAYPNLDIKNLTKEKAMLIYKQDYWDKVRADELPEKLQLMVFDTAVNMGVDRAIRILQEVAGASVDGILGPRTLKAVLSKFEQKLLFDYTVKRLAVYSQLRTFSTFGVGWFNRTLDTYTQSL